MTTADMMTEQVKYKLRELRKVVYLATEEAVADDIAARINGALLLIERLEREIARFQSSASKTAT